ncbi:guanylate cyclase [Legionella sainthelensi]|nr:guanylate cyclase [Legionella sainthelensi]
MNNTLAIKNMKSKNFYKLLFQIYRDAGHTSSLKEILTMLIDVTSCVIGCERGTIFLNDPKNRRVVFFYSSRRSEF